MSIAFVQKSPSGANPYDEGEVTALSVSFDSTPTVGNFILVCICRDDSDATGDPVVNDNQGNGNYLLAVKNADAQQILYIFYKEAIPNASGTFTVTATWSGSAIWHNMGIAEFSGVKASGSLEDTNVVDDAGVNPITTGNLDPSGPALYVGVSSRNQTADWVGVTADQNQLWLQLASATATGASAYRIEDGSALPVTWTYAAALSTNAIGAAFLEASGGGGAAPGSIVTTITL
jgi:hypothetical protein